MPTRAFLRCASAMGLTLAVLTGCDNAIQRSEASIESSAARTAQLNNQFYSRPPIRADGAQVSNANFVAPEVVNLKSSDRLPASAETATSVVLISREPLRLSDIAVRLSEITKIQHSVELGINVGGDSGGGDSGGDSGATDEGTDQGSGQDPNEGVVAGASIDTSRAASQSIRPNLRGSLSSVLDQVASAFDVEWTYKGGRVVFRDYVTRQYQLSALPVASTADSGSAGIATTSDLDLWDELERALTTLTSPDSVVSVGQGSGILTVTATLTEQEKVRDYVSTLNQTLGQQIAFDVNVLNVVRGTRDGFGVDIEQLAFGSGSNSVSWQGGRGVDGAIGSVNVGIIEGDLNLDVVIQALSSLNDVSVETRAGATTTNFQMIPIEVVERVNYVSSVSREVDDNGVVTTSLETDTETTGFQLQLLPRVLNAREVLLRYSLDLSDLVALDEFTSGDSTVQLPRVTESNFEQQVILKNGQTLVLSGFERQRTELKREGVGSPRFIGLGGSADGELRRATSIVFITPRLLSRGNSNN